MYPGVHAHIDPDKPAAIIVDEGQRLTYRQLEERSTRLADALRKAGLGRGDVVALLSSNDVEMFVVYWACLRSGLYLTPVNTHLTAAEAGYIIDDCGAGVLIVSADLADLAAGAVTPAPALRLLLAYGGQVPGFDSYEAFTAAGSPIPPADQPRGADMIYSSGTTGRPKGIKPALPNRQVGDPGDPYVATFGGAYAMSPATVYFSPAPLYHAAPLRFGMIVQSLGGTVLAARRFDPETALRTIGEYRVTHSQWVPTHFVRMLRLPEDVRARYDVRSQTCVIHAAAPCPTEVKEKMLSWFGPVLHEYYSSTEASGITMIGPDEWRNKPGSVGRAKLGTIHICDDAGNELPCGETGLVYFERETMPFAYHRDPVKTAAASLADHPTWSTCGDIGYLDADGYLFLRDRQAFTIISGGVNIYPQEIEDALTLHPDVHDVAVLGVPDDEYGELVTAVLALRAGLVPSQALVDRLTRDLRDRIAGYKVPRRFEFVDELPRTPTGKLVKGNLRRLLAESG
ncbi:acyl-CoA synthetase [Mycolicibacterium aichiense]|uniref:Acyl-CoA ligase n=1 Tax=Mycolicibacterium aichiense TaxID=1799 RepID=A0AAD1HIE0_9MYCO|nr:acyl-CoA synthetase [Mycolicibacterium aichiense]MCV7021385.1 acyl-CoA synthetase [Mycolicibacterium aichiense]BBX05967.1 putative acyl-CoA ligase [Mycolicibacterium aichiense]STZ24693.1 AMP-binding protein [Mycolicibacterium aichiense]